MTMTKIDFDTLPEIDNIYVGPNTACGGDVGNYHYPGSAEFERALNKARELGYSDIVGATFVNFPYDNNRAITLFFAYPARRPL